MAASKAVRHPVAIPHVKLGHRLRSKSPDGRVLELAEACLTQAVMDGLETWTPVPGSPHARFGGGRGWELNRSFLLVRSICFCGSGGPWPSP